MARIKLLLLPFVLAAMPAQAQIFWQPPDYSGPRMTGDETSPAVSLPGATVAEKRASVLWSLRSGLNVAALQCGFDRTLRIEQNYNAILSDHKVELAAAVTTLNAYFRRNSKTPVAGNRASDVYGGKLYSSFSAVQGQLSFCTAASEVSRKALFAKPGTLADLAADNVRALYNGVSGKTADQFYRRPWLSEKPRSPDWAERCWNGTVYAGSCG